MTHLLLRAWRLRQFNRGGPGGPETPWMRPRRHTRSNKHVPPATGAAARRLHLCASAAPGDRPQDAPKETARHEAGRIPRGILHLDTAVTSRGTLQVRHHSRPQMKRKKKAGSRRPYQEAKYNVVNSIYVPSLLPSRYAGILREVLDRVEDKQPPSQSDEQNCDVRYRIEPSGNTDERESLSLMKRPRYFCRPTVEPQNYTQHAVLHAQGEQYASY